MLKNAGTFDRIERLQAFVDAQKIYLQHMPAIFFGTPRIRIATSSARAERDAVAAAAAPLVERRKPGCAQIK